MEHHSAKPAKMLIGLVGRRRGETLVAVAKGAGARGGTITLGKSLGNNRLLRALSLADIQVDVVFLLTAEETRSVITAIKGAAVADPKHLGGIMVMLNVPELFLRNHPTRTDGCPVPAEETRSKPMESGYKLITVIVNSGYGDDVMSEARKAGATGGTILGARGTGTEEDVKFFGITLVPEKEMLLIVAESAKAKAITEAIGRVPTLCEPGGGIIFCMNVEEFIPLGG